MYYAVRKGYTTGVFDNWPEAQTAISGFSGSEFKKFKTKEEAEAYLSDRDIWVEQVAADNKDGYLVAFTDGSYDKNLNRYSYGVALVLPDGTEQSICGSGNNKEYLDSNNVIGEIFGVINAFDWAISNGYEKIKIYHDYEGLSKWITGEWNAKAKVSQMFVGLFKSKFEDFLEVEFIKVPGHSNVVYNNKADQLAKSALIDKRRVAVQGENWYSVSFFDQENFDTFTKMVEKADNNITHIVDDRIDKAIHRFGLNSDVVVVTLFRSGQHKLLVQGKNSYLFQVITAILVETDNNAKVEQILGSAYRVNIKKDVVDNIYTPIEDNLPSEYPLGIKRLIKQAVINLNYYIESEDYAQYTFPALRALEGHIKYLITVAGGTVIRNFSCFRLNTTVSPNKYVLNVSFPDNSRNQHIEDCYNYYVAQRHTSFHFGDITQATPFTFDNTRFIETKEEADSIIMTCIKLITSQ